MDVFDTIAAVSTPRGKGGVAVIRISGAEAGAVLSRVFTPRGTAPTAAPRRMCFGEIGRPDGEVLDEGLAVFFPSPASFTGEDVAEISCHGGALLTETVLTAVFEAGARPAAAGEFTRRALMNGKMGLSEAEALGALLEAKTESQLALARGGMAGRLSTATRASYERLTALLADSYAKIDFPDEDLNTLSPEEFTAALRAERDTLLRLAETYRTGHAVAEGVVTVICGAVNAGKSTLYNALVGREAAIVTEIAGTTRDVLTETVSLGGVTLRISDTAGLRDTADAVEKIGVDRAREALENAELVLAVFDASRAPTAEEEAFLAELQERNGDGTPLVVVLNKADLGTFLTPEKLPEFHHVVALSAKTGDLSALAETVHRMFLTEGVDLRTDAIAANARQHAALRAAAEALDRAAEALSVGLPLDAACVEAELAMRALGNVEGREVDEDIISEIFSHFCVGK